jgi:lysophospholipase L1-like esterase
MSRLQKMVAAVLCSLAILCGFSWAQPLPTLRAGNVTSLEDFCIDGPDKACSKHAMDAFYHSLYLANKGEQGHPTRITHFGDSIIAADYISATLRQKFQNEFGNGGPGFVFFSSPSAFHATENVSFFNKGFSSDKLPEPKGKDGLLGFSGAIFSAKSAGAKAKISTRSPFSRFELYYLETPKGAALSISADKESAEKISTDGSSARPAWKSFTLADGTHELLFESDGPVKTFGVVLERDSGVVYDNIGLISGAIAQLLSINEAHFIEQLKHRAPNLVVLSYGTNEANYTSTNSASMGDYQEKLELVLQRIKKAAPEASCLLISPIDAAEKIENEDGTTTIKSKSVLPKLVETQRVVARAAGCAFYDAYSAMGGKGSAATLYSKGTLGGDLSHPTPKGAKLIAQNIYDALYNGYKVSRAAAK